MTGDPPPWWPTEATTCFEDLVAYRLVGASACADRITAALVRVASQSESLGRDVSRSLTQAGRLFCGLKPDTALYRNLATALTEAGRDGRAVDVATAATALAGYRRTAQQSVIHRTEALLEDADTVLVHDYSSMVLRILEGLGARRPRRVVVTAGEPLGQGARVARLLAAAGHEITYTPDMSVARVIGEVDAFITGVESFYPDGSLTNTVGTVMLSLLCRETGVRVIAPAETLKCDTELSSVAGAALTACLLHPWPIDADAQVRQWDVVRFVLDAVPASLITNYVTEEGHRHAGGRRQAGRTGAQPAPPPAGPPRRRSGRVGHDRRVGPRHAETVPAGWPRAARSAPGRRQRAAGARPHPEPRGLPAATEHDRTAVDLRGRPAPTSSAPRWRTSTCCPNAGRRGPPASGPPTCHADR